MSAISRLCISVVGQSHLAGTSQVVGTSINVGIRIFSIVAGLSSVGGRYHEFGRWQLVVRGLHLLHRLRVPEEVWGRLRSWWSLVEEFTGRGQ